MWKENPTCQTIGPNERFHFVLVYVDDDLTVASHPDIQGSFFAKLCAAFGAVKRKHGDIITFLGRKITRINDTYTVSLPGYIDALSKEYSSDRDRPSKTPSTLHPQCSEERDDESFDKRRFLRLIGSLNFAACSCRFEILAAVNSLASRASSPTELDWRSLLRIVRYLKGTRDTGLQFHKTESIELIAHADASYNPLGSEGQSHTGYCFSLNNGAFHGSSTRQSIVALSSAEAEYCAIHSATLEITYLRDIIRDLGIIIDKPTTIFNDNKTAICWCNDQDNIRATKHIDLRLHYTRELIDNRTIEVKYLPTGSMIADILTKTLNTTTFCSLRTLLLSGGLESEEESEQVEGGSASSEGDITD